MHRNYLVPFLLAGCLAMAASLSAQSSELMDQLLGQNQARFGHAAYAILSAAGHIPETATTEEAATFAAEKGWTQRSLKAEQNLPLDQLSNLLMQSFKLPGGLLYSLFPSPRYAYRELNYLKITPKPSWPDKLVSGEDVVRMLGRVMEIKEQK